MFDFMNVKAGIKPSKGDLAQMAILEAAIEEFGHRSFEGARIREIASKSGQNLSAINYYFGSKQGLYLSVAKAAASLVKSLQKESFIKVDALMKEGLDSYSDEQIVSLVTDICGSIIQMVLTEEFTAYIVLIIMREQADPTSAFDIYYEEVMLPLINRLTPLVAKVVELPDDSEMLRILVQSIMGQILIFRYGQETIKRRNNWTAVGKAEVAKISNAIKASVAASILGFKESLEKGV